MNRASNPVNANASSHGARSITLLTQGAGPRYKLMITFRLAMRDAVTNQAVHGSVVPSGCPTRQAQQEYPLWDSYQMYDQEAPSSPLQSLRETISPQQEIFQKVMPLRAVSLREPRVRIRVPSSSVHTGFKQLFIVQFREQDDRNNRSDETHKHIGLRVPEVTLRSQKGFGISRIRKRSHPFKNFV
jgi:hypothetical protein